MNIHIISIFPEIFDSFLEVSLIQKAQEKMILTFSRLDPRTFCEDKHRQVDDTIYGWSQWMLMKGPPVIAALKKLIHEHKLEKHDLSDQKQDRAIIMPTPSKTIFTQELAETYATQYKHLIFLCGRYEGIDARVEFWINQVYPGRLQKVSLWQFITLGGETPAMVMIESITRLIGWVIKEESSHQDESYSPRHDMTNLEYPQYTRPQNVEWFEVPETLLSWHHKNIEQRKKDNTDFISDAPNETSN